MAYFRSPSREGPESRAYCPPISANNADIHQIHEANRGTFMLLKRIFAMLVFSIYSCTLFAQAEGGWLTFRSAGHDKSNGINLTIKYPSSWSAQEGNKPHVVQKFIHPNGTSYATILIQDLGIPEGTQISEQELDEFFTPSKLKDMVPDGMQFISAQKTTIEGLPAGILEYKATEQPTGQRLNFQVWSFNFIREKSLIQLQFTVGGTNGNIDSAVQMQAQKPIFRQMANSIAFLDKQESEKSNQNSTATANLPINETQRLDQDDGIKPWERDWGKTSESSQEIGQSGQNDPWTVVSRYPISADIESQEAKTLSHTLNNGGGLGNVIFIAIFFFFGTAISYALKVIFFRKNPPKKIMVISLVSLSSLALLILLIVDGKINSNVAGMLTASFSFGAWKSLNNSKLKIENEPEQPKKTSNSDREF